MVKDMQLGHLALFFAQHKDNCLQKLGHLQPENEVGQREVALHALRSASKIGAFPEE